MISLKSLAFLLVISKVEGEHITAFLAGSSGCKSIPFSESSRRLIFLDDPVGDRPGEPWLPHP